jgi:hypothetical protein
MSFQKIYKEKSYPHKQLCKRQNNLVNGGAKPHQAVPPATYPVARIWLRFCNSSPTYANFVQDANRIFT